MTVKIAFIYRSNYIALMLEALFYFSLTVGTHLLYVQLAVKIEIGDDDDHHSDVYQLKRLKKKLKSLCLHGFQLSIFTSAIPVQRSSF